MRRAVLIPAAGFGEGIVLTCENSSRVISLDSFLSLGGLSVLTPDSQTKLPMSV
jgi:hypothetical protein